MIPSLSPLSEPIKLVCRVQERVALFKRIAEKNAARLASLFEQAALSTAPLVPSAAEQSYLGLPGLAWEKVLAGLVDRQQLSKSAKDLCSLARASKACLCAQSACS